MLRKNNRSGTERKLSVLSSLAVPGVVGCIVFGIGLLPVRAADSARTAHPPDLGRDGYLAFYRQRVLGGIRTAPV